MPPPWMTYSPLLPLVLLLFTGLYLFALPYAVRWRARNRSTPWMTRTWPLPSRSRTPPARRRQPRPDPRPGRAREQPEGRQRRDPQAAADGVHRRLGIGQVVAGVRHHRGGVAAADQRDLQRVRAGLHADAGPARGRRPRRADDRDHRRPGADGRQLALDGRHRRPTPTRCCACCSAASASRTSAPPTPSPSTSRRARRAGR